MRILVLNGPNLNLLGQREPSIYGRNSLADLELLLTESGTKLGVSVEFRQSNHEGQLVDWLQLCPGSYDGVLFNPGGYSHTSVALLDAILAVPVPVVEVHLSNLSKREEFRHSSITAKGAVGRVEGFGIEGYRLALLGLVQLLQGTENGLP